MTVSTSQLLSHVVAFARSLRHAGIVVTPGQTATFARALGEISIFDPEAFFYAAQSTLLTRQEDRAKFAEAFRQFWQYLGLERFPTELLHQTPLPPKKDPKARPGEVGREPRSSEQSSKQPQPVVIGP